MRMTDVRQPSRSSRWIFVPVALVVVLGVAWSGFWWFAAQRAEATIAAWIEQEAGHGRLYSCASRTVGGFPFRIEVRCTQPAMELTGLQPPRVIKARDLVGLAQVYQPNLIIAEIAGPVSIAETGQPAAWQADWALAQASLRGVAGRPERLSVVIERVTFNQANGGGADTLGSADHLELHVRRSAAATDDKPVVDFAAEVAGAVVRRGPLGARPLDAEITGALRGVSDLRPKPLPERLKEWQAAGGRLELTKLRIKQGEAVAVAAGDVGLSPAGRPDGAFNITMAGFDALVRELVGAGGNLQLGLLAGLAFLGRPAEIEGKRAVSVALRFSDGATFLGPIPLGRMEPFY
jgi:hypothetical protein